MEFHLVYFWGFFPFLLSHDWEPSTPSQVLYQAWVGKNLGSMSMEEWVTENSERVLALREQATGNYREVSEKRKGKLDTNSQYRKFERCQRVWYRTPGLSELSELKLKRCLEDPLTG